MMHGVRCAHVAAPFSSRSVGQYDGRDFPVAQRRHVHAECGRKSFAEAAHGSSVITPKCVCVCVSVVTAYKSTQNQVPPICRETRVDAPLRGTHTYNDNGRHVMSLCGPSQRARCGAFAEGLRVYFR